MDGLTITASNLSKRFNREWIFRNLSYQFISGNTYAIRGPNGSGKSTLLQVLWGQMPPTSGSLRYDLNTSEIPVEVISRYLSIATPYMDLIDEFTLMEQLRFHFKLRRLRQGVSCEDLLKIMYLEDAKDKFIGNFSSGMKQRLKLALALYTEAQILFLDEPGTNLDRHAFEWYKTELHKLPPEGLIFIATNNPEEYPASAIGLDIPDYKIAQKDKI